MSWRFWVRTGDKPFDAGYYDFKTLKVYNAYRWFICEKLDKTGFIKGTVNPLNATEKDFIYSHYADRFI